MIGTCFVDKVIEAKFPGKLSRTSQPWKGFSSSVIFTGLV